MTIPLTTATARDGADCEETGPRFFDPPAPF
jgi:hypothetical protein